MITPFPKPRPNPSHPRRRPRKKRWPMTVIVGLLCQDGLVIASDSQESDEGAGMKRLDVTKVYGTKQFGFDDVEIIVAGTGGVGFISRAAELIEEKGYAPHFTTPRSVATVVEDVMGDMAKRYGGGEEGLELGMMVGVFCRNCPKTDEPPLKPIGLYVINAPSEDEKVGIAEPVTDYAATGSGGLFATYLFNRLHDETHPTMALTVDTAIREAVYVIEEVKKVDLWCGGPTQMLCIRKKGDGYILEQIKPREIKRIAADLADKDSEVKAQQRQILLGSPRSPRPRKQGAKPAIVAKKA